MTATTDKFFSDLWTTAKAAAQVAAEEQNAKLGAEGSRGFDCGFAWVSFPGNMPFGRWAKKQGLASKGYPTGLQIWYSKLHTVPTQSTSVHEAAARAARDVLAHGLQTSQIYMGSRLATACRLHKSTWDRGSIDFARSRSGPKGIVR